MENVDKLYQYIDEHAQEYISLAQRYVQQPSVVATGQGMREMADILIHDLKQMGFHDVDVTETDAMPGTVGWPILFGRMEGTNKDKTIGMYNHYDTQPVEPLEEWISGPFSAEIRDGRIWGRGIVDNKGSIAAKMSAIKALQAVYGQVPLNINFIIEGEEEAGSVHMNQYLLDHPERVCTDAILMGAGDRSPSGEHRINFGGKGILYVQLSCTTAEQDMHSMYAPLYPSPAWRLVQALNTLKDFESNRILIDGFYDSIRPATDTELMWLSRLKADPFAYAHNFGADKHLGFYKYLTRENIYRHWLFEPWLNICGITTGWQGEGGKNVIPKTASCKMDFRLVPGQDSHEVEALLLRHLDNHGFQDVVIDWANHGQPACRTDMESPFCQILFDTTTEVSGKEPDMFPNLPGSSAYYAYYRIHPQPIVNCGGNGNSDSRGHSPNENCYVSHYIECIKIYAAVMKRFADCK